MILDDIKRSRPNLSENTYRTYFYNLKGICKYIGHNPNNLYNINFLKNYDKTIKCIEKHTKSLSSIKSKLTAIIVALKSQEDDVDKELIEKYSKYMENVIEQYDKFIEKNEKSIKQQKNWLDYRDLIGVCNKLMVEYEKLRKKAKKTELYDNEFKLLQGYIMLRIQLEYPIRNDMANMRVLNSKEYDDIEEKEKMKNNYLVVEKNNMVLHINNYKTSKKLGPKEYKIPKNISKLLLQWLKINKSGFLFVKPNKRDTPVNETDISRLFIQLFKNYYPDKNISTSMIRHILISYDRQNDPTIQQQKLKNKKIEDKYLHSSDMNSEYRKK